MTSPSSSSVPPTVRACDVPTLQGPCARVPQHAGPHEAWFGLPRRFQPQAGRTSEADLLAEVMRTMPGTMDHPSVIWGAATVLLLQREKGQRP